MPPRSDLMCCIMLSPISAIPQNVLRGFLSAQHVGLALWLQFGVGRFGIPNGDQYESSGLRGTSYPGIIKIQPTTPKRLPQLYCGS